MKLVRDLLGKMSVREKAVLLLKSQVTHISPQRMTESSRDSKPGWFLRDLDLL